MSKEARQEKDSQREISCYITKLGKEKFHQELGSYRSNVYGYLIMISDPKELITRSQPYMQDGFVLVGCCSVLVGFFGLFFHSLPPVFLPRKQ